MNRRVAAQAFKRRLLRCIADKTSDSTLPANTELYAVLDLLQEGVVIMGSDGRFQFTNAAALQMLGRTAQNLVGVHHTSKGTDLPLYDAHGKRISVDAHPIRWIQSTGVRLSGEVIGVDRLDGRRVWVTGHGCLIHPDLPETSAVLFSFTDITAHHDARERLLHDATHDWLTGLRNRGYALDQAKLGLASSGEDRLSAVMFVDLDRLKEVNDGHGHAIGDAVLRIVAQRMQSVARPQDLVARIGGDEFILLVRGALTTPDLEAVAARLHDVFAGELKIGSLALRVGASIGVTVVRAGDGRSLADVLRDADAAMYQAKAQGPNRTAYSEQRRVPNPTRYQP